MKSQKKKDPTKLSVEDFFSRIWKYLAGEGNKPLITLFKMLRVCLKTMTDEQRLYAIKVIHLQCRPSNEGKKYRRRKDKGKKRKKKKDVESGSGTDSQVKPMDERTGSESSTEPKGQEPLPPGVVEGG
jgi:hypothetical protein